MALDTSQLNIGDRIEVRRIEPSQNIKYSSQVLDIIDEKTYSISGPIQKGTIVPIRLESSIEVTYFKEEKGRFLFKAVVLERQEKGVYKLKIKRIDKIIKFQQRDYFRLPVNLKIVKIYSFMDGNVEKKIEENCITKDISGGGIRFLCNFKHNVKDIINLRFIVDGTEIVANSEIIRVTKSECFDYSYEIGIRFMDVKNSDRDIIIKFIFEQQRKQRRKGLM